MPTTGHASNNIGASERKDQKITEKALKIAKNISKNDHKKHKSAHRFMPVNQLLAR
jgi:hypothetical protein